MLGPSQGEAAEGSFGKTTVHNRGYATSGRVAVDPFGSIC
jgi:hypothetical protein